MNEGLHVVDTGIHAYKAYQNPTTENKVQVSADIVQTVSIILKYTGKISESSGNGMIGIMGASKILYDVYLGDYWNIFSQVATTITLTSMPACIPPGTQLGLMAILTLKHAYDVGYDLYEVYYEDYNQGDIMHEQLTHNITGQLPNHNVHDEI